MATSNDRKDTVRLAGIAVAAIGASAVLYCTSGFSFLSIRRHRGKRPCRRRANRYEETNTNKDGDRIEWMFPVQDVKNLTLSDSEYSIAEKNDNPLGDRLLTVCVPPSVDSWMKFPLPFSSFSTRVFRLESCTEDDIRRLKRALRRTLGSCPCMAGRFIRTSDGRFNIILPLEYMSSNEDKPPSLSGGFRGEFGIPFRVVDHDEDNADSFYYQAFKQGETLRPVDTAIFADIYLPKYLATGEAPLMSVCIHRFGSQGAVIGIGFAHAAFDGWSVMQFIKRLEKECQMLSKESGSMVHSKPTMKTLSVSPDPFFVPFQDMDEFRAAQMHVLGKCIDDGHPPSLWEHAKYYLVQNYLMRPMFESINRQYLALNHPHLHRHAVTIHSSVLKAIKAAASPPKPDWIATIDALMAKVLQCLIQARVRSEKMPQTARVVFFLESRSYLDLSSDHISGSGFFLHSISIENPATMSLSELALSIRKGLLSLTKDDARRINRLDNTFQERKYHLIDYISSRTGGNSPDDSTITLCCNNITKFALPDFGNGLKALSMSAQAGPSLFFPTADGGCRFFLQGDLCDTLSQSELQECFTEAATSRR